LDIFDGIPQYKILIEELGAGIDAASLLAEKSAIFPSKGEAKKTIQGGGVSVNKEKVAEMAQVFTADHLINDKFIVVQKGKKNYFLLIAE
jgi:tyrosyl-tRNA synthetase